MPFPETEGWPEGSFAGPWPLSEDLFLAAYSPDRLAHQGQVQRENAYGIYLVDTLGGRELIYRDPAVSCFSPIPLRARQRPPALPRVAAARQPEGTFYVLDVTRGTPALAAGSIKRMRVVQVYGQPTASVPARSVVENEVLKRILGTVPVNADGSAAFRAPAGVPLLFQMLDENGMAVMSMRSQAYLQPGETAGCVGCHEARNTTPPARIHSAGLRARAIEPAPGPAYEGGFSFARTVQPVLDRHCIGCHGLSKTEAGVNLVGTPQEGFSTAYLSLVQRPGLVSLAHRNQEKAYSTPRVYGAHAGRLAPLLLGAHRQRAPLDEASFTRIAGWLDLNCQYYGDYSPQRPERRRPSPESEKALRAQVQAQCGSCHAGRSGEPVDALVNIAQPDESRVLMAPLAKAAGGWGQCDRLWTDATTQGYREMRGAVGAAAGGWPAAPRLARK